MSVDKLAVLLIGLEPETEKAIEDLLLKVAVRRIPMEMDSILQAVEPAPAIIIVGSQQKEIAATELAQTIRMQYQDALVYLCAIGRVGFERRAFIKNGFNDAFLMPMDTATLTVHLGTISLNGFSELPTENSSSLSRKSAKGRDFLSRWTATS